jgi:hypothetical protein
MTGEIPLNIYFQDVYVGPGKEDWIPRRFNEIKSAGAMLLKYVWSASRSIL